MNTRIIVLFASLTCILGSIPALAQEEGETPAMSAEQQAEMMAWMELAQPGAHHEHLDQTHGHKKSCRQTSYRNNLTAGRCSLLRLKIYFRDVSRRKGQ